MNIPEAPKIYHILHVDRLASILNDQYLWSDAIMQKKNSGGTMIGMSHIKERRLSNELTSRPGLYVGDCVPFYFCPRSIMLYIISQQSHADISYRGGQDPIIHLQADLRSVVLWANKENRRWAFTDSNAGSSYFNDYAQWNELEMVIWEAIEARDWRQCKEQKQAEFLLEKQFPWHLIEKIGVFSQECHRQVETVTAHATYQPTIGINREWYY